jgi:hypothetical protein
MALAHPILPSVPDTPSSWAAETKTLTQSNTKQHKATQSNTKRRFDILVRANPEDCSLPIYADWKGIEQLRLSATWF